MALVAGFAGTSLSTAATPTITVESQAWWRKAGIELPQETGAHIMVKTTIPVDGYPVNGRLEIPVTVTLHDIRGSTNWFRVGTEDQLLYQRGLDIGPCNGCATSFTASIDVSDVPTGRHELRISVNNPDEDPDLAGEQRMFQSTGYQFCVRSCTPSYRGAEVQIEARGWYTGVDYQNVRLDTDPSRIRSGALVDVRFGPGAGGAPTKFAGIYIDPDFHMGSAGKVVWERAGPFAGSVRIPSVSPGRHRLVLVSSDGQNAGVLVVPFTQGTSTGPVPVPEPQTPTPTPTPTTKPPAPPAPPSEPGSVTYRIPDSSAKIGWQGRWSTARHRSYLGGSVHWTKTANAKASLVFIGNRIRWIGPTGPTRGKAKIYIDGRYKATVNLYSARFQARRVLFSAAVRDGRHRITIVALATPGRPMVAIDAFEVRDPR